MRYYSSDFHFGSAVLLDKRAMGPDARKYESLDKMHEAILKACSRIKAEDTLIHLGDLACVGSDREWEGLESKAELKSLIAKIPGNKVFIQGNHDASNCVSCAGRFLIDLVGKYKVTMQHYPSYHECAFNVKLYPHAYYQINLCGHVHSAWKVHFDKKNRVLNINVGLDRNGMRIYSESELVALIEKAVKWFNYQDTTAFPLRFDDWEKQVAKDKAAEAALKKARTLEWLKVHKPEIYAQKIMSRR